jgi:competence protein ComEA
MFEFPHFSNMQRRAIYFALAMALAVGAIFFSLAHGNAATPINSTPTPLATFSPVPIVPIPPIVATKIVVDVAGKVLHPGIYRLPQGSRAIDAIKAAGKQLKGVSLMDINLAEVLSDGQQIIVGAPAITSSSSKSKKSSASKGKITSGTININTATVAQFQQLPGVGAVMAARIFAYRTAHGAFATINDLTKVSGMGKSKFANLRSFVRI